MTTFGIFRGNKLSRTAFYGKKNTPKAKPQVSEIEK